ncbi:MAG: MFS transporter [Caulobacter sp.]|nr:MFS transporter [Caulobacter sp.]
MTATTQPAGRTVLIAIGLCLLAAMLEGFDIASMGVAAPKMMPDLGLTRPQAGWAFSASLIGLFFGAACAGPLSDRVGRKPVLLTAMTVFGLFSLGTAMIHAYAPLLAVRFLTGLGLGGAMPMLIAMASELASPGRRTAVVSGVTAGLPMGGALVGLLARTDLAAADWRVIFLVGGGAPLVLALALWAWLPETGVRAQAPAKGAGLAALFGRGRLGTTLSLWVSYAAIALVLHLFLNWLPSLLVARGVEGKAAAGISTLFNLGGAAGGVIVGLTIDRMGARWPLAASVVGLVAVLFALAAPATGLPVTAALAFALGFLVMATQFGLYGVGPGYYAPAVRGTGVGAAIAAGRFGSAMGPVLAGQLLGGGATTQQVVMSTVPIVLLAGVAAMALTVVGKRVEIT